MARCKWRNRNLVVIVLPLMLYVLYRASQLRAVNIAIVTPPPLDYHQPLPTSPVYRKPEPTPEGPRPQPLSSSNLLNGLPHLEMHHFSKGPHERSALEWSIREIDKRYANRITPACNVSHGLDLYQKFRASNTTYCGAQGSQSRLQYFGQPVAHVFFAMWEAYNVKVEQPKQGELVLSAQCPIQEAGKAKVRMPDPKNTLATMTSRMKILDQGQDLKCERWVEHPVMLIEAFDTWNWFHFTEQHSNLFFRTAVVEKDLADDLQVVITGEDDRARRYKDNIMPLMDSWSRLLSDNRYPLVRLNHHPLEPGTCFRQLIWASNVGPSIESYFHVGNKNECFSSIMRAYADHYRAAIHIPVHPPPTLPRVCFMARDQTMGANPTSWQQMRIIGDEAQNALINGLRDLVTKRGMEYEEFRFYGENKFLSLGEQANAVSRCNVLFGMHGAGLGAMLFLPPNSFVLEAHRGSGGNYHFENIATTLGLGYSNFQVSRLDAPTVWPMLERAIEAWTKTNHPKQPAL